MTDISGRALGNVTVIAACLSVEPYGKKTDAEVAICCTGIGEDEDDTNIQTQLVKHLAPMDQELTHIYPLKCLAAKENYMCITKI